MATIFVKLSAAGNLRRRRRIPKPPDAGTGLPTTTPSWPRNLTLISTIGCPCYAHRSGFNSSNPKPGRASGWRPRLPAPHSPRMFIGLVSAPVESRSVRCDAHSRPKSQTRTTPRANRRSAAPRRNCGRPDASRLSLLRCCGASRFSPRCARAPRPAHRAGGAGCSRAMRCGDHRSCADELHWGSRRRMQLAHSPHVRSPAGCMARGKPL